MKDFKKRILISIVIPVKNGISTFKKCLDSIQGQTLINKVEIIVIDSGSTDGTIELVQGYSNVRLYEILPKKFNHGSTRNYGVELSKGDFVVMTVQDAIPVDKNWLETMLRHFVDDEVVGVCGQQIVPHHPNYNPHEWFRPVSKPSSRSLNYPNGAFKDLPSEEKHRACRWDDVNAMYRKSVLKRIPFEKIDFGEDMMWARTALEKGYKLVYDSRSQVEHYHHSIPNFVYKRSIILWYSTYKYFYFNPSTKIGMIDQLKMIYRNFKWGADFKWIIFNLSSHKARNKAYSDFNNALNQGEDYLNEFYYNISHKMPIGQSQK